MTYCSGRTRATANINWSSGNKEIFVSNSPPVEVASVSTRGYSLSYRHDVAPNNNNFQNSYNRIMFLGNFAEPVSYRLVSSSDLKRNDLIVTSGTPSKEDTINITDNIVYGSVLSNLQLISDNNLLTTVTITEINKNRKFSITYPGTAQWEVDCDDDCPPGTIKCVCPEYPGYCCISCSEMKNGIAAATAAVRGINRG